MQMIKNKSNNGFSLIELAVVVVIIALIIGGIMAGRSMIDSANLQSVAADYDRYRKAAMMYRDKFGELPGDHSDATSITSEDAGCDTPTASNDDFAATCDGNGDGFIGDATGDTCGAITNYHETLWAWQHMANAGFIDGKYNGRRATTSTEIFPGTNVPESTITGASFMMAFYTGDDSDGDCYLFTNRRGHAIYLGAPDTNAANPFLSPIMKPDQAKSIDLKIDDGKPGLGNVMSLPSSGMTNCADSNESSTAVYEAGNAETCALILFTGF